MIRSDTIGTARVLPWQPATASERYGALDVLRGAALFGVLLVNLLGMFRVPLSRHILTFHTDPGWANHLADLLLAGVLEFKAFALFSFLFGVGVAIQIERAAARRTAVTHFLVRRFLVLLLLGLCHLLLIWNGDILTLYAVCGLLLVPLIRLPGWALLIAGAVALGLPSLVPLGIPWPSAEFLRANVTEAMRVYGGGGYWKILAFRWRETGPFIVPLLLSVLPRTLGLMLWGVAAWRYGVLRQPERHRTLLFAILAGGGAIGGTVTAVQVLAASSGRSSGLPSVIQELGSSVPLAFAYAALLLLWWKHARTAALPSLAAAGQMALTNYLLQSVILGFLFYGYGLGLFGRMGPAPAALLGIVLYTAQLAMSRVLLRHFRFGPFEWLWRSMTYGRRQPMLQSLSYSP